MGNRFSTPCLRDTRIYQSQIQRNCQTTKEQATEEMTPSKECIFKIPSNQNLESTSELELDIWVFLAAGGPVARQVGGYLLGFFQYAIRFGTISETSFWKMRPATFSDQATFTSFSLNGISTGQTRCTHASECSQEKTRISSDLAASSCYTTLVKESDGDTQAQQSTKFGMAMLRKVRHNLAPWW